MIKAVFLDYSGTITKLSGPDLEEMTKRCVNGSNIKDPSQMIRWWFDKLRVLEENAYLDHFVCEEDLCMEILHQAEKELGLKENLNEIQTLNMNSWMYAPIYDDVKPFLENCPVPVYIITNNAQKYIDVCLKRNGLHVNGVITGEMVHAYKPHHELFEKALEISECLPEEALMVGDSYTSDVQGARGIGMQAYLLDRSRTKNNLDCRIVSNLREIIKYL